MFMNSTLIGASVIDEPLEFLLFSDFAVVLAYVHLYTLFMVVPIFNSMMRIDRALIEAARDAGAGGAQILWNVVLPLAKPGIAISSIFVVTLVMGDFITVRLMSGGQSASIGIMIANDIALLQYPAAAANVVVLLLVVLLMVTAMLRLDPSYEEAARDLGASPWQTVRHVVLPIILPSIIGVALFGFTLFYDEFARTLMTAGSFNTLPLEIYGMTTNVTTPVLYALGTLTTAFSFTVIGLCLAGFAAVQRRASRPRAGKAG